MISLAHTRLDCPTSEDEVSQHQLSAAISGTSSVAWRGLSSGIKVATTALRLLTQFSVLVSVLKDQEDGTLLAFLSVLPSIMDWLRRQTFKPSSGQYSL